jgi:hypothetical protein
MRKVLRSILSAFLVGATAFSVISIAFLGASYLSGWLFIKILDHYGWSIMYYVDAVPTWLQIVLTCSFGMLILGFMSYLIVIPAGITYFGYMILNLITSEKGEGR